MINKKEIEKAVKNIIHAIGDDSNREGLIDTPKRVSKMYEEFFSGLNEDPAQVLLTSFEESYDDIVLIKDLQFFSICEHHFIPFYGIAHISYIPNGKVVGASKLSRSLDILARRPQIQERLTNQFVEILNNTINPKGVAIIIEAEHLCMSLRGIKKPGSKIVTSKASGLMKSDSKFRDEFFSLISS
ncbi:MAG: GTP cyclohydrolase I FolE [Dehalococcoidia bacterium]